MLVFIISRLYTPFYVDRYIIGASLAFYLLIATGIENISKHRIIKLTISLLIAYLLLVSIWGGYYNRIKKDQWREVVHYVETHAEPGDLVLVDRDYLIETTFNYYAKRTDLIKEPIAARRVNEESVEEIVPLVQDYSRVWTVVHFDYNDHDLIADTMAIVSYDSVSHKKYFRDLTVDLWQRSESY